MNPIRGIDGNGYFPATPTPPRLDQILAKLQDQ